MTALAPVDAVRVMPRDERLAWYRALPPGALAAVATAPAFWARPEQALPAVGALNRIELFLGGRRAGKTLCVTWLFLREYLAGRIQAGRIIASTEAAILDTVITGQSGIWTWLPYEWKARCGFDVTRAFARSKGHAGTFQLPGLPPVICISAEKPGSAVGQGKDFTFADDPAAWTKVCGEFKAREMFREARISTSEGPNPCIAIPTTLDGIPFLRRALGKEMRGVSKHLIGSARGNTSLSPEYLADVLEDMISEGGDVGELDGVERIDVHGAMWRWEWILPYRVPTAPELIRVVVAVDPADTGERDSDETGIVVVGLGMDGRLYVLADYTGHHEAAEYAAIAAWAFRRHKAEAIVTEVNRAESAVRACMAVEAPNVAIVGVDATRSKAERAAPIAALYREGRVSHVASGAQLGREGGVEATIHVFSPATLTRVPRAFTIRRDKRRWTTLEDELTGWDPRKSKSPNGMDALVWACWHLAPPEGDGFAASSRFAGIGGVAGPYHDDDVRNDPGVGIGYVQGRNADPRWAR